MNDLENSDNIEYLTETTVNWLGDQQVRTANIWEREYTLQDNITRSGLSAQLYVGEDKPIVIGVGSTFNIGSMHYEVVGIDMPEGKRGVVKVREITS